MAEKRDKIFSIRLTQQEFDKLKELAKEKGQSTGGYIFIVFGNVEEQRNG